MLLIDTEEGRIVAGRGNQGRNCARASLPGLADEHLVDLDDLPAAPVCRNRTMTPCCSGSRRLVIRLRICGSSWRRWPKTGVEPMAPWGRTRRWRCCRTSRSSSITISSNCLPRSPILRLTAIREEIVTSTETTMGSERNLFKPEPESCRLIKLKTPILTNEDLANFRAFEPARVQIGTLADALHGCGQGAPAWNRRWRNFMPLADEAIADGANILILVGPGHRCPSLRPSRRCWRCRAASSFDSRGHADTSGLGRGIRRSRGKCIISPC